MVTVLGTMEMEMVVVVKARMLVRRTYLRMDLRTRPRAKGRGKGNGKGKMRNGLRVNFNAIVKALTHKEQHHHHRDEQFCYKC
jgi:hypothetical protein